MIFESLNAITVSPISTTQIIDLAFNNLAAVLIGLFIFLTYKLTYNGTAYSKKFNASLGMMVIITSLIMNVISNNVALSLGLVGALSIIRFRAAIKDIRDATFIFWAIGVGICCGTSQYLPAIITSVTLLLFLLILGQVKSDGIYLIIIKATLDSQFEVERTTTSYFEGKQRLRAKSVSLETVDIIYEINMKTLTKIEKSLDYSLIERLSKIPGVLTINQIEQTEEISR